MIPHESTPKVMLRFGEVRSLKVHWKAKDREDFKDAILDTYRLCWRCKREAQNPEVKNHRCYAVASQSFWSWRMCGCNLHGPGRFIEYLYLMSIKAMLIVGSSAGLWGTTLLIVKIIS